jgi:hypothetical protein
MFVADQAQIGAPSCALMRFGARIHGDRAMPPTQRRSFSLSPELERERIITLQQVAELKQLSTDTIRRRYSHLIRRLSPRRVGMKLGDALDIGQ